MCFAWLVAPAAPSKILLPLLNLELSMRDMDRGSAKELEAVCKRRLWQHLSLMANMQREGQLLLLKFYDRIYK